jgi:hypothetical protein
MSLWACWPRGDQYYGRNDWAGAIQRDGLWTMDSPASNALAHFINVALFFAGPTPETSATPVAVEAELYRARRIENYDTCSLRLHLPGGVPLLVIFTHACQQGTHPVLTIHGAKGRVHWGFAGDIRAESADGKLLRTFPRDDRKFRNIVYRFTRLLRGLPTPEIALATLEVIERDGLVEHAARIGSHALARMQEMKRRHPLVGDVRGRGFLLGMELVTDREAKTPAADAAESVLYRALSRGLSFKTTMGNVLTLTPPLITTREQMDDALDILDKCLAQEQKR